MIAVASNAIPVLFLLTLLMLTTSLAPELKGVDDVGEKGDLPMLLQSFRFGKP